MASPAVCSLSAPVARGRRPLGMLPGRLHVAVPQSRCRSPTSIPWKAPLRVLALEASSVPHKPSHPAPSNGPWSSSGGPLPPTAPMALALSLLLTVSAAGFAPLASAAVGLQGPPSPAPSAENPLIKELLERTKANKEKYAKERLEDYYRRNFKDYMDFIGGTLEGKKNLSENEKAILEWRKANQ